MLHCAGPLNFTFIERKQNTLRVDTECRGVILLESLLANMKPLTLCIHAGVLALSVGQFICCPNARAVEPSEYTITEIALAPGVPTWATSVNDSGQVLGFSF